MSSRAGRRLDGMTQPRHDDARPREYAAAMPVVRLRQPLKRLAGDRAEHPLEGATVLELMHALERAEPATGGWILDERGHIRRHINVFLNGERCEAQTPVCGADRVDVLPAISGGATA
jgi:molybdopterin synthase sulfur carrier subunit